MSLAQDRSFEMLASSPARYPCTTELRVDTTGFMKNNDLEKLSAYVPSNANNILLVQRNKSITHIVQQQTLTHCFVGKQGKCFEQTLYTSAVYQACNGTKVLYIFIVFHVRISVFFVTFFIYDFQGKSVYVFCIFSDMYSKKTKSFLLKSCLQLMNIT